MMETIYPSPNGQSVIPQEKLDKEIRKGTIKADDPNAEKDLDGDMDERIDQCIKEVWSYYDPKGTGILPKKILERFFKDALEIYALRCGRKSSKEVMSPNVKYGEAMETAVRKVTATNQASFKQFEDFINCYDLEEALGSFLGVSDIAISNTVQWVDTAQIAKDGSGPKKPVYRDYPKD